jgi:hypothetical protein
MRKYTFPATRAAAADEVSRKHIFSEFPILASFRKNSCGISERTTALQERKEEVVYTQIIHNFN